MTATMELESIVAKQQEREAEMERMEEARLERERERQRQREREGDDFDYVMADLPMASVNLTLNPSETSMATPVLTTRPWMQDDWEMVECAA